MSNEAAVESKDTRFRDLINLLIQDMIDKKAYESKGDFCGRIKRKGVVCTTSQLNSWLDRCSVPDQVLLELIALLPISDYCSARDYPVFNTGNRIDIELLKSFYGLSTYAPHKSRSPKDYTGDIGVFFQRAYDHGRFISHESVNDVIRNLGNKNFLVVMTGSIPPNIASEKHGMNQAACQAIANGATIVMVTPGQITCSRWKKRGHDSLMYPFQFIECFNIVATNAVQLMIAQGEKPERARVKVQERLLMIATDQCEHIRLSVGFAVFGQYDPDGKINTAIHCGVRYADKRIDEQSEDNRSLQLRIMRPGSWFEYRVLESVSFLIRDSLLHTMGQERLFGFFKEKGWRQNRAPHVIQTLAPSVLEFLACALMSYFSTKAEWKGPFVADSSPCDFVSPFYDLKKDPEKETPGQ